MNPIREAHDYNLQVDSFAKNLTSVSKIANTSILHRALVLEIDRIGSRFIINRPGANNDNNMVSSPFTIRARLLTNYYNNSDGLNRGEFDGDEIFAIPEGSINRLDIPEAGETILIRLDYPFTKDGIYTAYWIGRENAFATKQYNLPFKYNEASANDFLTHDESVLYGGNKPQIITKEYSIKPERNYEPYPWPHNFKSGDVFDLGKSNTLIKHTFDIDNESDKRGYLEFGVEYEYIHNTKPLLSFDFRTATESEIIDFQKIQEEHIKYHLSNFRKMPAWQWQNCSSRIIIATKTNIDRHLIHKNSEKDGTGQHGNMKLEFDQHFRDEGPGKETPSDNSYRKQIGKEIKKEPITSKIEYKQNHNDIISVKCQARKPITFDIAQPSIFLESDDIKILSRKGGKINHMMLGETYVRWMQEVMMIMLKQNRDLNLLNDRIHKLAIDFLKHRHTVVPGQSLEPMGSPYTGQGTFLKSFLWYDDTTEGDVGGDSKLYEESGSDSVTMKIRNRLIEERNKLEELINRMPEFLSNTHSIN